MLANDREMWYLVHMQSRGSAFKQVHPGGEGFGMLIFMFFLALLVDDRERQEGARSSPCGAQAAAVTQPRRMENRGKWS